MLIVIIHKEQKMKGGKTNDKINSKNSREICKNGSNKFILCMASTKSTKKLNKIV